MASFPDVAFVAAVFSAGPMAGVDEILPTSVVGVSVVGGENDDRVIGDPGLVDGFDDLSGGPVGFHNEIGDRGDATLAGEFF